MNKILIALHDYQTARTLRIQSTARDYQVEVASDIDKLLIEAEKQEYSRILMDANFGYPNAQDVLPAIQVYQIIRQRVEQGLVKFLAISSNEEIVRLAQASGIPAAYKPKFDLKEFLEE